jgi:hypothetical protein
VAYESAATPIKRGYLFDFVLPDGYPEEMRVDLTQSFKLVYEEGLAQGAIDRRKWAHLGWMGAGHLVAHRFDPDGKTTHLVKRFGQD